MVELQVSTILHIVVLRGLVYTLCFPYILFISLICTQCGTPYFILEFLTILLPSISLHTIQTPLPPRKCSSHEFCTHINLLIDYSNWWVFKLTYWGYFVWNLGDVDLMSLKPLINLYIGDLTPTQIQNLKTLGLWVFLLIYLLTSSVSTEWGTLEFFTYAIFKINVRGNDSSTLVHRLLAQIKVNVDGS